MGAVGPITENYLEARFVTAVGATGKPRGLRWKDCRFDNTLELAREKKTGELYALVPITIQFEAIEGSDMEGLPAVNNLRTATAVFYFQRGQWLTAGPRIVVSASYTMRKHRDENVINYCHARSRPPTLPRPEIPARRDGAPRSTASRLGGLAVAFRLIGGVDKSR